ncbi:MAG: class D beta-lactamase [Syntrophothermus sp.]
MNKLRTAILLLSMIITACSPRVSQPTAVQGTKPDMADDFHGFDGAFVLYDLNSGRYTRYNPERCDERLLPASTFKILNALVGLETGVIPDESYVIPWDGTQYEIASWNQDHTLKTAFQNSVVWYYREVARRIGRERMQQYIDAVGYGNQDMTGNLDSFWLDGAIRISAEEQVKFLIRLYQNDLPFSKRSMDIVRDMMTLETGLDGQVRGKTGSGFIDSQYVGWFVGYQEVNGDVLFFATNITSPNADANGKKAREITLDLLKEKSGQPMNDLSSSALSSLKRILSG